MAAQLAKRDAEIGVLPGPAHAVLSQPAIIGVGRLLVAKIDQVKVWRNNVKVFSYLVDLSEDRKSTRLNSSHTVISYAVFCLKKKKTTQRRTTQQYSTG